MKEFFKKAWKYILAAVIGLVIGILINIPSCSKLENKIEYIPVYDTITVSKDRIVEHTKVKYVHDTLIYLDSIISYDTINHTVILPVEYKEYKDTLTTDSTEAVLDIHHHGIYSEIDSINIDYKYLKERETIIQKPKKVGLTWCVGPQIGVGGGLSYDPLKVSVTPYIGVGVTIGIGGYLIK